MAMSLPVENLVQPATDNEVRDSRSNWLVATPSLMGITPWAPSA